MPTGRTTTQTQFLLFWAVIVIGVSAVSAINVWALGKHDPAVGKLASFWIPTIFGAIYGLASSTCWTGAMLLVVRVGRRARLPALAALAGAIITLVALYVGHWQGVSELLIPVVVFPGSISLLFTTLASARGDAAHEQRGQSNDAEDDASHRS